MIKKPKKKKIKKKGNQHESHQIGAKDYKRNNHIDYHLNYASVHHMTLTFQILSKLRQARHKRNISTKQRHKRGIE